MKLAKESQGPSAISMLVAKYRCPRGLARLAVERGLQARAAELADRDPEPSRAFVAAVNALTTHRQSNHEVGETA